jgi:hypothetical protein
MVSSHLKVKSTDFGGKIIFFRPLALRHWVPFGNSRAVLDKVYQAKKTASRYDED